MYYQAVSNLVSALLLELNFRNKLRNSNFQIFEIVEDFLVTESVVQSKYVLGVLV